MLFMSTDVEVTHGRIPMSHYNVINTAVKENCIPICNSDLLVWPVSHLALECLRCNFKVRVSLN